MKLNLKTSAEQDFSGVCPRCHEHTSAGESCCGEGAWVEGGIITDEDAQETRENPTVSIKLLTDVDEETARKVHSALFDAGVPNTMWAYGASDKYNVTISISLAQLPVETPKKIE